jgi:predicted dithiol-disulfide oxidoreductase (DUF899 family)
MSKSAVLVRQAFENHSKAMTTAALALPPIVNRFDWLKARKALLAEEKAARRTLDALAAQRRRLPMVPVEKSYLFQSPAGPRTLPQLFEGRRQLYVHHFMWNDEEQRHCPGCTEAADVAFDNPHFRAFLAERDVTFVGISRAPLPAIEAWRQQHSWTFPWYSCAGTTFSHDFGATIDEAQGYREFNYRTREETVAAGRSGEVFDWGDVPANSVFLRDGEAVYHTYSAYTRGLDHLFTPWNFLDLTPCGRQQDWEDSPAGWPQQPTYGAAS